jgi:hypothetical protein
MGVPMGVSAYVAHFPAMFLAMTHDAHQTAMPACASILSVRSRVVARGT